MLPAVRFGNRIPDPRHHALKLSQSFTLKTPAALAHVGDNLARFEEEQQVIVRCAPFLEFQTPDGREAAQLPLKTLSKGVQVPFTALVGVRPGAVIGEGYEVRQSGRFTVHGVKKPKEPTARGFGEVRNLATNAATDAATTSQGRGA
jgi:hypothetical protein